MDSTTKCTASRVRKTVKALQKQVEELKEQPRIAVEKLNISLIN
ncbi:hypothetical protein [Bacillus coahuilensis]|nr:hypothetical protein [Bacillus coahuilensis]